MLPISNLPELCTRYKRLKIVRPMVIGRIKIARNRSRLRSSVTRITIAADGQPRLRPSVVGPSVSVAPSVLAVARGC